MDRYESGLLWLNEQIRLAGINPAEVARRGDFDAATLSNVLNGHRKMGRKLARKVAFGLGLPRTVVYQEFGLKDEDDEDNEGPDEETLQLGKLLLDIKDQGERRKAMGLVTALLRQIALAANQGQEEPGRSDDGGTHRAKGREKRSPTPHK